VITSKELLSVFSKRLRTIRDERRIVQADLAKSLNCSEELVSNWMTGKRFPVAEDLIGISRHIGVSVDFLLGLSEIETIPDIAGEDKEKPVPQTPLAPYLWYLERTKQMESKVKVIWDATPDFYWIYTDQYWSSLVLDNICERKVKFYFLYKDTEENKDRAAGHARRVEARIGDNWHQLVHYVPVESDSFPGWAEHLLYDPFSQDPHCIMVTGMDYLQLDQEDVDVPNLEFTPPMRDAFARWFKQAWNKRVTDPEWIIP
jgi:transcriptional regulator with XRE-family HTH domain